MCDLSVIIVNFNAQHFLQLCLDALQDALADINAEVIVVDNQSSDDSCAILKQEYTWVRLIENTENEGFGKANNKGAALAKGRHLLILNPDTIVSKQTINESLSLLDSDESIGGIGVKMLDGSGLFLSESKRGLPTPAVAFYKAFGFARLLPKSRTFARYYLGHLPPNEDTDVEVLAGAYMMIPSKVYLEVQGFDEDFFMYGEDVDLSYRITLLGYRLHYLAQAPILHFKGESASRDALWAKRFYEAMALFSEKHFSSNGKLLTNFINLGIALRKRISTHPSSDVSSIDPSQIQLTLLSRQPLSQSIKEKLKLFSSYEIRTPENIDLNRCQAVLALNDISKTEYLSLIQKSKGKVIFFFMPNDESFVSVSPNSQSCGQVFTF